jgi:protein-L-isoaspartate O-methyltransferase
MSEVTGGPTNLLVDLNTAELLVPPMQKLFVAGNILPGTDVSPERLLHFVDGLSEVTGMNLFGEVQVKTPEHYDIQTLKDLGRPPEDINVSWMWDDSGGQMYIFPTRAYWATLDLHTCKQFDPERALGYIASFLNFRENMRFSEQDHHENRQWQPYVQTLPENPYISEFEAMLAIDPEDSQRLAAAGKRLEAIVYMATSEGWGERLASLFSETQRKKIRDIHSAYEISVDDAFMDRVLADPSVTASDYRFQKTYDRLAAMEAAAAGLASGDRVIHVGSGWPGTAIGFYMQKGIAVTCLEVDSLVAAKSRAALERLGLYGPDKISVENRDGRSLGTSPDSTILVSAMVPSDDKLAIIENIRDTSIKSGETLLILRQPADPARSLFYQPLVKYRDGIKVNQTQPGVNDPLLSTVVEIRRRAAAGRLDDTCIIAARERMKQYA